MPKTVKDCLIETFEDLNEEQFKKFKSKLIDRKGEPRIVSFSSGQTEKHFLDVHRTTLIERVNNVNSILDRLQDKGILNSVSYSDISTLPNDHNKMRALYDGPLKSCGNKGKDDLLSILQELQPYLMDELMKK
ncbi:apoptosis-associated speck-like protein containing a CARD isoform X4 [Brienomyrus brachyistius]|uniref:apoptosis-associated speck-like protein containing a CARD isoform X4 n=1 Tax=Brienomyrus brachyistius TaxID=42636 RepID=UPI0020B3C00A|nr:apoptosis-associated speck-like protein containing a CARD isoform X4 [Brienomyrus brachyistius]